VPLPGATRPATAASAARGQQLALDAAACRELAAQFLEVRGAATVGSGDAGEAGEVVMVMGMPAAGKSLHAESLVAQGYARLNRDERGGTLLELARALDRELAAGTRRVVVDNTYGTRAQRAPVLAIARRHGLPVRCIVVAPPLEQAQAHAVARILARHGRLLEPAELRGTADIAPRVQFGYRRTYEPPHTDEGFATVTELVPPRATTGTRRALVVELDDVVWRGRPRAPADIALLPEAAAALVAWSQHALAATVWRPGATAGELAALAARLRELLGGALAIDVVACTHPAGPPICWCRKPLPGLALALARTHDLDLAASVHLGRGPADRGFAVRAGMRYAAISDGWPRPE